jgi:hypothetical protein
MPSAKPTISSRGCVSRQHWLTSQLPDLTPFELGKAVNHVRTVLSSLHFNEVLLSPLEGHPIDYLDNVVDIPGIGQLRFNTEPDIWESSRSSTRYYSISTLFRRETEVNPLRRLAFFLVDFYQHGSPDSMLPVFQGILDELGRAGFAGELAKLPFDEAAYDPVSDGPRVDDNEETRWVIASGYDANHSFFEIDERGVSTRREVFLVTPIGFLEVGVFGITGWNRNSDYVLRAGASANICPDLQQSGMGFGLERLLLAERILSIVKHLRK